MWVGVINGCVIFYCERERERVSLPLLAFWKKWWWGLELYSLNGELKGIQWVVEGIMMVVFLCFWFPLCVYFFSLQENISNFFFSSVHHTMD